MHAETVAGYRTEGGSRKKACVSVAVGMARDAQSIIIIHKLNKLKLQYYYWHARLGDARDAWGGGTSARESLLGTVFERTWGRNGARGY